MESELGSEVTGITGCEVGESEAGTEEMSPRARRGFQKQPEGQRLMDEENLVSWRLFLSF